MRTHVIVVSSYLTPHTFKVNEEIKTLGKGWHLAHITTDVTIVRPGMGTEFTPLFTITAVMEKKE